MSPVKTTPLECAAAPCAPPLQVLIAHLGIWKSDPGSYAYTITVDGRDDVLLAGEGFSSMADAIGHAARDIGSEGPITACEVSYRAITGGTFTPARLRRDAEDIAKHLVETFASVML